MLTIYIKSIAIVKLIISEDDYQKIIGDSFFESYIPNVSVLDYADEYSATISIKKAEENGIKMVYPDIVYQYNDDSFNSRDIISLIEYVLERARQEKGIICIHGAGAVINDKLIVCWGTTTGMGKTSLALKLSEMGYFYSDEKVLIDLNSKTSVGGLKNLYISNDFWKEKFGNDDFYTFSNNNNNCYEIGLFVQPILCNQEKYEVDIWDENKFMWHLYEESSRKIRGTSRVFFNNTIPASSLDDDKLSLFRLNLIRKFTKSVQAIYYKGNEEEASRIIEKIMNNEKI